MSSFELKGKMLPCSLFRPLSVDLGMLGQDLAEQIRKQPTFFQNMPVLLDLRALGDLRDHLDLSGLTRLLRTEGLLPVGVQGGNPFHERLAQTLGLGVFPETANLSNVSKNTSFVKDAAFATKVLIIDRPVRSGQQIYARGGDLVVTASVGTGAEVVADGNVHIYGALRGRALAGVLGNEEARIFCRELQAELISVAGLYRVSEDIADQDFGLSVQVRRSGNQLLVEPL